MAKYLQVHTVPVELERNVPLCSEMFVAHSALDKVYSVQGTFIAPFCEGVKAGESIHEILTDFIQLHFIKLQYIVIIF